LSSGQPKLRTPSKQILSAPSGAQVAEPDKQPRPVSQRGETSRQAPPFHPGGTQRQSSSVRPQSNPGPHAAATHDAPETAVGKHVCSFPEQPRPGSHPGVPSEAAVHRPPACLRGRQVPPGTSRSEWLRIQAESAGQSRSVWHKTGATPGAAGNRPWGASASAPPPLHAARQMAETPTHILRERVNATESSAKQGSCGKMSLPP